MKTIRWPLPGPGQSSAPAAAHTVTPASLPPRPTRVVAAGELQALARSQRQQSVHRDTDLRNGRTRLPAPLPRHRRCSPRGRFASARAAHCLLCGSQQVDKHIRQLDEDLVRFEEEAAASFGRDPQSAWGWPPGRGQRGSGQCSVLTLCDPTSAPPPLFFPSDNAANGAAAYMPEDVGYVSLPVAAEARL